MKFSIILPAYNATKTINKCIQSVISQSYSNWELIAIDDGSSDNTYEVLQNYSNQDSRIIVVNQKNSGPGFARNKGISLALGDYIAFIDADDYWENDFLELINEKIKKNDPDIVFYDLIHETETGRFIRNTLLSKYSSSTKEELLRMQMTGKFEWGMVKVIRKSIIAENNLHFSPDAVGEEAIFSFDVLKYCNNISFVDKPVYHYVSSTFGQHKKGDIDPWWRIVDNMREHLQASGALEDFIFTVNSFAAKAMSISLYRISVDETISDKKQALRKKIDEYSQKYDFAHIDANALDKKSKLILRLAVHRRIRLIVLISKFRRKFM